MSVRKKPIPDAITFQQVVDVCHSYRAPEDRALATFLYLFGARVGEALRSLAGDLRLEELKGKQYLIINLSAEKKKQTSTRTVPISLEGPDKELARELMEYAAQATPEQKLFTLSRQRAYNHLSEQKVEVRVQKVDGSWEIKPDFKIHPHYFRHCRATHLMTIREPRFDQIRLMKFFGWKSSEMVLRYGHLVWQDLTE